MIVKMFASLKNKIREETGSDVTLKVSTRRTPLRGRHSRQGSTSSLNSIVSADGIREELDMSPTQGKYDEARCEEDLQKILMRKEAEFEKRSKEQEKEWKRQIEEADERKNSLERERDMLNSRVVVLEESLKMAEEQKRKLAEYRDDKEQLENLQAQEIAKVKQLLLIRERELAERTAAHKEGAELIDSLRAQVSRLRHNEQELSCVQDEMETLRHASAREKATLAAHLAQTEEDLRRAKDRIESLESRILPDADAPLDDRLRALVTERNLLERRLEEAHVHLAEIKTSWSEKITSLETQVGRLSRQAAEEGSERRRALQERDAMTERIKQLEFDIEKSKHDIDTKDVKINRLIAEIDEMSNELRDLRSESEEEVTFLRKQIENSGDQIKDLKDRVAESELRADEACAECRRAISNFEKEKQVGETLRCEIEELKSDLESERTRCTELFSSFDKERSEKDVTLLRNAQVSQEIEMARQRIACQDGELTDVQTRLLEIEATIADKDTQLQNSQKQVVELQSALSRLQEDVSEKEKNIKVLQQRLAIMKKTLQRELRSNESDETLSVDSNAPAVLAPSSNRMKHVGGNRVSTKDTDDEDINFKYLKHVIIKFLTSREYEAKHLTRAVATLLKFSPEEEKLLQETLEWKMSWFGSRPKLGNGQLAMAIPPS